VPIANAPRTHGCLGRSSVFVACSSSYRLSSCSAGRRACH